MVNILHRHKLKIKTIVNNLYNKAHLRLLLLCANLARSFLIYPCFRGIIDNHVKHEIQNYIDDDRSLT